MKNSIKKALITLLIGSASVAFAASGAEHEGNSLVLALFLGFGALVIVFQLFPGVMLFVSMVKGLFSSAPKESTVPAGKENDRIS
ncbi:MAG: hypothetical protein FD174_1869 [Geobacteraceae bacterium]|nr:MAG: hypothetical protein FD174_1869 [Geobacteraceae bacterium]